MDTEFSRYHSLFNSCKYSGSRSCKSQDQAAQRCESTGAFRLRRNVLTESHSRTEVFLSWLGDASGSALMLRRFPKRAADVLPLFSLALQPQPAYDLIRRHMLFLIMSQT